MVPDRGNLAAGNRRDLVGSEPSTKATYSISDGTVRWGTPSPWTRQQTPVRPKAWEDLLTRADFHWQYLHTAVLLAGPNIKVQLGVPTPNPGTKAVAAAAVQLIPINNVTSHCR